MKFEELQNAAGWPRKGFSVLAVLTLAIRV